jgi:hypothetical protein
MTYWKAYHLLLRLWERNTITYDKLEKLMNELALREYQSLVMCELISKEDNWFEDDV